eukprot:3220902-Pyramimonas_sp.AAC.1
MGGRARPAGPGRLPCGPDEYDRCVGARRRGHANRAAGAPDPPQSSRPLPAAARARRGHARGAHKSAAAAVIYDELGGREWADQASEVRLSTLAPTRGP